MSIYKSTMGQGSDCGCGLRGEEGVVHEGVRWDGVVHVVAHHVRLLQWRLLLSLLLLFFLFALLLLLQ